MGLEFIIEINPPILYPLKEVHDARSRYPAGRNIQLALAGGAGGAVTNYRLLKRSNLAVVNHEQVPQCS